MADSASPERWRRIQQLFAEVVGLDPERREARLDQACQGDPLLRGEVQALLERYERGEVVAGRYRLIEELGRGAMGVVHKAYDFWLRSFVALKFLSPHRAADHRARSRFTIEARAVFPLKHPNICAVHDIGKTEDGRVFIVMDYYPGETLEARIARGPLPVAEAVRIATHVARGLAAARQHEIVHRDIKPSNVLVTDEGVAKILDFGIAKTAGAALTDDGDTLGTVEYMSPDQLRGQVDARTDVWALGVTLYEMLAGERPFRGDYVAALHFAILHMDPVPLTECRADVPEALAAVVRRCLEKDPEKRYQSADEVEADLARLGEARASRPPVRPPRWPAPPVLVTTGFGSVLVMLLLAFTPLRTAFSAWLEGPPGVEHLAVLPFMSPADEATVGEGLTLTLTSLLGQLGQQAEPVFTVVPASEMRAVTTAEQARERFRVGHVIAGDFRQRGGQALLTLDLVDARTLRQLRTERLAEPESRLHVLERRALAALADMLDLPLSDETQQMLAAGGTTDAEALGFYLKGKAALQHVDQPEQIDLAIELFQWALQNDSLYALAHAGLGQAYVRKYRSSQEPEWVGRARQACTRALALAERLAPVRVTLGQLHDLTGDYEGAVREFNLALAIDGQLAAAYYGLGEAYRKLGRNKEAEASFQRAIELQPQVWLYHNDLAAFYLDTGRYAEAEAASRQVIQLAPDNPWGYNNLGNTYLFQQRLDEARQAFEQAVALKPYYPAYANLGYIYFTEGRPADEARMYERALALDSSDFRVWGNLAGAYERSGAPERARSIYERAAQMATTALDVNPDAAATRVYLADYAERLGREAEARRHLGRALAESPEDATLAYRAAVVYERLGERAQALKWIERALQHGYPRDRIEKNPELEALRRESALF